MAVLCGQCGVDLEKILIRSVSVSAEKDVEFKINGSVLHMWQVYRCPTGDVAVEPVLLTQKVVLNSERCYIVLHTFGPVPTLSGDIVCVNYIEMDQPLRINK